MNYCFKLRVLTVIALTIISLSSVEVSAQQNPRELFQRARMLDESNQNLGEAIKLYGQVVRQANDQRVLAARAQYRIGVLNQRLGRKAEAQRAFQTVVNQYQDQTEVARDARAKLPTTIVNATTKGRAPVRSQAKGTANITARQLWASALDVFGSVSPDGRFISYAHWETGDLGVYDTVEGKTRLVTKDGTWGLIEHYAYESIWSPDGTMLAYSWFIGIRNQLRIVGIKDSTPRVVFANDDLQYVRPHAWSQDGKQILAVLNRKDTASQIALINVADGTARILKSMDWRTPVKMSLSPDGRFIAYDMIPNEDSPQRDIFLLSADGSREIPLVEHPATDYGPMWMPDGKSIVFGSDRTGTVGLYILSAEDGKPVGAPRLIQQDMNRLLPMSFGRDGTYYFARATAPYQNTGDIFTATLDPKSSKLINPPKKVSLRFEGVNSLPSWSPDGKWLAYVSQRGPLPVGWGSRVLVLRSLETGEERVLTPKLDRLSVPLHNPPQWSPDGRTLLVVGRDVKGSQGIYLIDTETSAVSTVIRGAPGQNVIRSAKWAKGGKAILYVVQLSEDGQVVENNQPLIERDLSSGKEKTLAPFAPRLFQPSPDGEQIALFCCTGGEIQVMPASGGDPKSIFKITDRDMRINRIGGLQWTPDGKSLLVVAVNNKENKTEVLQISVATGEAKRTDLQMEGARENSLRTISLHPNGRQIAFTGAGTRQEIWAMENLLPSSRSRQQSATRR